MASQGAWLVALEVNRYGPCNFRLRRLPHALLGAKDVSGCLESQSYSGNLVFMKQTRDKLPTGQHYLLVNVSTVIYHVQRLYIP